MSCTQLASPSVGVFNPCRRECSRDPQTPARPLQSRLRRTRAFSCCVRHSCYFVAQFNPWLQIALVHCEDPFWCASLNAIVGPCHRSVAVGDIDAEDRTIFDWAPSDHKRKISVRACAVLQSLATTDSSLLFFVTRITTNTRRKRLGTSEGHAGDGFNA